jgi:hypothetical protein
VVAPGAGAPNAPTVRIYQTPGSEVTTAAFTPYAATGFGANVAAGNLDGVRTLRGEKDEVLTGPGPGAVYGPQVRAFRRDLANPMAMIAIAKVNFYAYGTLKYGTNVCACDVDGDGMDEILTGAGPGAVFGPHVRGFDFDGGTVAALQKINFFAYGTLKYGVNVGCGEIDADPFDEILTAPGPGSIFSAQVRGWSYDGASLAAIAKVNFNAFAASTHGGKVAGGDVEGDGIDEIGAVRGAGATQANQYAGFDFDGAALASLPGFSVTPRPTTYGGSIAIDDVVGKRSERIEELLAGSGPDPGADTTVAIFTYDGSGVGTAATFVAFPGVSYGVNVVGGGLAF